MKATIDPAELGKGYGRMTVGNLTRPVRNMTHGMLLALDRSTALPCASCGAMYGVPCGCIMRTFRTVEQLRAWGQTRGKPIQVRLTVAIARALAVQYDRATTDQRHMHVPCPEPFCNAELLHPCIDTVSHETRHQAHHNRQLSASAYRDMLTTISTGA